MSEHVQAISPLVFWLVCISISFSFLTFCVLTARYISRVEYESMDRDYETLQKIAKIVRKVESIDARTDQSNESRNEV